MVAVFAPVVSAQWNPEPIDLPAGQVLVVVDRTADDGRSVSLVRIAGGASILSLSPARAQALEVTHGGHLAAVDLGARLERAGVVLNDPDHLFYLPVAEQDVLIGEAPPPGTRPLTQRDSAAFDRLTAEAPEHDLDEAFVELDHWLVHGTFVGDVLVSAASMYPWAGTRLADLGVITLPAWRGRGLACATVRSISAAALARGYEPQYRCQLDNVASVALAHRAGFARYGEWDVIVPGP